MNRKFLTTIVSAALCAFCAQHLQAEQSTESSMQKANITALVADSNLTLETLPNGMLIAVYPNIEPPVRVSMRLLVRRGSSVEKLGEEGIAHFIEHMAFNGTENFPKGDMIEYFQRLGMAFGADTNAHTGFTETVYKIDMPSNDAKILKDGLTLLRDYAGGVLFPPEEIERERGVIIAEKKSRDTASYRATVNLIQTLFPESPFANRFPIGEESTILNAPRSTFVDFYKAHYRPENMALVIVGDIKPASVLGKAKKIFEKLGADKISAETLQTVKPYATVRNEPVRTSLVQNVDMRDSSAGIYIAAALDFEKDCIERRIRNFRFDAIAKIISLRFDARKSAADSKFSSAYADFGAFEKYADIFSIGARSTVGGSEGALEEVVKMYMGILSDGFGEWELEKAKNEIVNMLESEILGKSTRATPSLASGIAAVLSEDEIITSPETDLEIALAAFENFDAKIASEMFREFVGKAQVFSQLRDIPNGKNPEYAKFVFENLVAGGGDVAFSKPLVGADLLFEEFSGAGAVKSESVDDLEIHRIVFENNVRANLKKTDFAKDEILINIAFGGGKFDLPKETPALMMLVPGFILGGTAAQSFDEISVAKSDKSMDFNFKMDGDAFIFSAKTTPKYLADTLNLMATHMATAAFRQEAAQPLKKLIDARYRQLETNPDMSIEKIGGWLTNGDFRLRIPEKAEVEKLGMDDLRKWFEPILANSYMEISIVGDISEVDAKALLLSTFASMPARAESRSDYSEARKVEFTSERETEFTVKNVNDERSYAVKLWPTCGRADIQKMRAANLLGAVVNDVVRKHVRENSGKVYSPAAFNNSNPAFDFGMLLALSDVTPEFNADVLKLLDEAVKSVSENITQDEFDRAKLPLLKQLEKTRRMNAYWAESALPLIQADPQKYETARTLISGYEAITLDDVKAAADEFLKDKGGYTIRILPFGG